MTHVLVTFLGAPDRSRPPTRRPRPHYQEITYAFRGCTPSSAPGLYTERFFPFALREHLEKTGHPIQEMVIFGTPGSAWDEFLLNVGIPRLLAPDLEDLRRQAWRDAVQETQIQETQIQETQIQETQIQTRWGEPVRKALRLNKVQLKVIDYAEVRNDQVNIIAKINDVTKGATEVTIDVTHGLRYMPLLGSVAAYVVETTRGSPTLPAKGSAATVKGVWYGALDLKKPDKIGQEIAPAIDVGGLSRIVDWLTAFKNFDWDGDYGAFAEPLKKGDREEQEAGKLLAEAAFFERLGRFVEAQSKFKDFDEAIKTVLEKAPGAHGLIGLFKDQLRERIELSNLSAEELYEHQCRLAWHHLKHEDVVHAAIWGREAAVTRITLRFRGGENIRDYSVREGAIRDYGNAKSKLTPGDPLTQRTAWEHIKAIRNAFAHAAYKYDEREDSADKRDVDKTDANKTKKEQLDQEVATALLSVSNCKDALEKDLNCFLQEDDPNGSKLL